MIIRRMTATFGCLDGAVLELQDGLNVFTLPNESGKSTWAAFLTAMFYGVDTGQRAAKGKLPDKTRYQPWNGKPMEGLLELEDQGKTIVLQRTSSRGKPMGQFRAWDKETGLEIPGLTADNCGRRLLGVERAVFQRSAFLSGADLTVTQDQELARRLGNLAAAGQEGDSYPLADGRLKLWQNRCRYHRTGLIPQTEEELEKTNALLAEAEDLRRQRLRCGGELEQCTLRAEQLETLRKETERQTRRKLEKAVQKAQSDLEAISIQTAALPSETTLQRFWARLEQQAPDELQTELPCPPALEGLDAEEIWPKAQTDAAEYETLTSGKLLAMPLIDWIFAGVFCIFAVVAACFRAWYGTGITMLLAALYVWNGFRAKKRNKAVLADRAAAKRLLETYGVKDKEALLTAAIHRRDWLLARDRWEKQSWEWDLLLEQIREIAPDVTTSAEAKQAVEQALALLRQVEETRQARQQARLALEQYAAAPEDPEIQTLHRRCAALEAEIQSLLRQEQALGSWEALQAEADRLQAELKELEKREQALLLAREALASANSQLAQVYAPQLTGLAGTCLSGLTNGRYDGVVLDPELNLSVREQKSGLIRPLAALSRGTQDQIWLALRLAMTRLLLPPDAPILLDDALLTFDRQREQAALDALTTEHRQVILFTCR